MDTSEQYIKMSRAIFNDREHFFPLYPIQFPPADIRHLFKGDIHIDLSGDFWAVVDSGLIPLFRQDQLQEMIGKDIGNLIIAFNDWLFPNHITNVKQLRDGASFTIGESAGYSPCTSMEQLWLAFLMWTKYQKIWDGEDWINETQKD